jgi:phenylacetate-coenzyme A ligase PaaK-like adenylate-forming protein
MGIWSSLNFGLRAIALERGTRKHRSDIEQIQRTRLDTLVQHAAEHSAYYREKFAGIDRSGFSLEELPTSNKAELMERFDDVLTVDDICRADVVRFFEDDANQGQYFRGKYALSHTSGSQGQPLLLVQTKENIELLFALQASRGNRQPVGFREVVRRTFSKARLAAVTLKPGFYPTAAAFEYMTEGVRSFVKLMWVSVSDADLLKRLQEFRPTHLTAYASNLHALARYIEQGRLSFKPGLEQVINTSERLMPQARIRYEQLFGAPIYDDYGMGECLFLTNGCPTSGGMHVNSDWAILEVVDENNRPVSAGKKGAKVLVTNLANYVQPIIRYEIGDIVTMATKPCNCGSNLPLIARVDGRDSDMLYIETAKGTQPLPPAIFEHAMSQIIEVREYQLIQEESNRFRVLIEPLNNGNFDRERANHVVAKQLELYGLNHQVHVKLEVVEQLAPDGYAKFKRVVSKISEQAGKQ